MAKATPSRTAARGSAAASPDQVPLRDPVLAAALAWLIPGAGHWYQGRRSKAVLFFVCILGTFIYGLYLGEGRVVYASMRSEDRRLHYFSQLGAGLPALPALVQAYRVNHGKDPIKFPIWDRFMVPPSLVKKPVEGDRRDAADELDELQKTLNRYFELGTVYTMVAGLLNVLVIYDAWGGPAEPDMPAKKEEDEEASSEPPSEPSG
ncbi:MAG: hypothetical protein HYX69_17535 [Planctomycetia bacterium]|nr:hypothetical protein [Planctomycetia bacterium]